ncbi:MAG TPA: PspC domain-containing protein, partial [Flavisolibacter sp.]|nr:PspC domain-containing protein [Flavisolibacter sp.]
MKKIININLYGRVIPIEDAAYDSLQRYIESLRRYFAKEEGRDEIINDIESRIAELMNDKIKKGAPCITEADIAEIITAMGRVEDFEAADRSDNMGTAETASTTSNSSGSTYSGAYQQSERKRFTGRLYRDGNDKFLGGVCSGIAAYMNVDPTVVRLLFAIITFGGFGLGFLLYIILWIVLPLSNVEGYVGKRFFRNPDDQILGGVCGGLAAYFNKSASTIRLIFAAPLLLNIVISVLNGIFNIGDFDFGVVDIAFGSLTSTFIIAYIILWIVLPMARSPYDKMEMRGEKVDVNRIKQNVQEGMGDFKSRAKDWGDEVRSAAQKMSERAQTFTRTQGADFASDLKQTARPIGSGIGHAIGVLFKSFFLFIAGVFAFAFFVVVLAFTFGGVAKPINTFLLDGFWQKASMWGVILFFLAVPLIAIITWVIRRIMKVRSQKSYLGWTFGGLWTIGWICLPIFISSVVKDFRFTERTETAINLDQPRMGKLVVQAPGEAIRYSGNFAWINADDDNGWDITDDSLKLSNIRIEVQKSEDSLYHVTVFKYSAGHNRNVASQRAEKIDYRVTNLDSVLSLGSGFGIGEGDKFRGQKVLVEIKVPVGKQIRFDNSVGEKLNPYDIRVGETENHNRRRNWNRRDFRFEWDNNRYYDWQPDTDYYMTADGDLKQVGIPETETEKPAIPDNNRRDSIYKIILDSLQNSKQRDTYVQPEGEETTKRKEIG